MILYLLAILFTVSPTKVSINDPVTATLEIESEVDIKPLRSALTRSGDFFIAEEMVSKQGEKTVYQWTLEPLRAGFFPVSLYKIKREKGVPIFTKAYTVEVLPFDFAAIAPKITPIPLDPKLPPELNLQNQQLLSQILQNQPLRNRQILNDKAFPWHELLFAFLAIAGGLGVAWYLDWKERNTPLPTPEAMALKELNALYNLPPETFTGTVTRITEILRGYIQNKYRVKAPYLTTQEFLKKTSTHPVLQSETRRRLGLFLSVADEVKFSGKPPSDADVDTAYQFASSFIESQQDPLEE